MSDMQVTAPQVNGANAGLFRTNMVYKPESKQTVKMIRTEIQNGKEIEIIADLPCGNGWNQGNNGSIDWQNLQCGWVPYDTYMAKKHSAEVESKRATRGEK